MPIRGALMGSAPAGALFSAVVMRIPRSVATVSSDFRFALRTHTRAARPAAAGSSARRAPSFISRLIALAASGPR